MKGESEWRRRVVPGRVFGRNRVVRGRFSKRGMRIQFWRERAGSQDTRQIHRPTIPARHSLFLRRSPSPSVCIGDVERGCADVAQRPGGGTRLLRSRQRRDGSFRWILGEFLFF